MRISANTYPQNRLSFKQTRMLYMFTRHNEQTFTKLVAVSSNCPRIEIEHCN